MRYEDKKEEVLRKCNEQLKKYDDFYRETMNLGHEMDFVKIDESVTNIDEEAIIDWLLTTMLDVYLAKFSELFAASTCVEKPSRESVENLESNIKINVKRK